ncbi:hypothetical protein LINPERPRIM_LOCUS37798 [Linum perenne]
MEITYRSTSYSLLGPEGCIHIQLG